MIDRSPNQFNKSRLPDGVVQTCTLTASANHPLQVKQKSRGPMGEKSENDPIPLTDVSPLKALPNLHLTSEFMGPGTLLPPRGSTLPIEKRARRNGNREASFRKRKILPDASAKYNNHLVARSDRGVRPFCVRSGTGEPHGPTAQD